MINNDKMKPMETEQYYSLEEVANELKVAYLTVYRWVQAGKLKAHQIEKQYRVSKVDFDAFVDARKSTTTPKLQELSKDELINMVRRLKKQKKFGLIWEDSPETVAEQCKKELPVLEQDEDRAILESKTSPTNILIEGDNYHALSVLNYTHAGKIDVIYVDPPYNTGAKDWKYNNDYVDSNDTFRHSKWLSFMEKRLKLAKGLLSAKGVLICTIDENEHATLGLLLADIFPEKEIVCITIVHNPGGIQGKNFSFCHEYAYFVYPRTGEHISSVKRHDIPPTPLRDWGKENSKREGAKNCFYPIIVRENNVIGFGDVSPVGFHPQKPNIEKDDGTTEVYPIDRNGVERKWRFSRQSVEGIKDELIAQSVNNELVILRAKQDFRWKTVWTDSLYNANVYGTQLLNKIISVKFPFPKSLFAVRDSIKAAVHDKDTAVILDFFAGSGTTAHATLLLNKEDGGSRRFILCTNNEGKIIEEVCYPRIRSVIEGVEQLPEITNIPANLRYFKTAFVSKSKVSDDTRRELVRKSTEMICIRENTFEKVVDKKDFKIYSDNGHTTGVLFNLDAIAEFKKKLQEQNKPVNIYVFSLSNDTYDEDFEDLGLDHKLCPIPESILEVYRKLFRSKK